MSDKKSLKINFITFLLILIIFIVICMACYICIKKLNSNKEIAELETKAIDMQNTINELQEENNTEDTIKVLVERHTDLSGMPGPNGGTHTGTSKFIASNGYIYEYKYDEYSSKSTSYPNISNIEELSTDLLSKAKKTKNKLTDEELKLVKEYINNIEKGNENIIEIVKSSQEGIPQIADALTSESFRVYNYVLGSFIEINSEIKSGTFYESPSITKLFNIVNNYI